MKDTTPNDKQRIGKVTTRAGDSGNSKLATGRTVGKHEPIFQAIGSVDELNSHVGLLISLLDNPASELAETTHTATLKTIQQDLFNLGAVMAMEGQFDAPSPTSLEDEVATLNAKLPPLTEFVLPGGGMAAAQSHVCRTVCRRSESDMWRLIQDIGLTVENYTAAARYLNRLSDYFFVLARTLTATEEEQWQGPNNA